MNFLEASTPSNFITHHRLNPRIFCFEQSKINEQIEHENAAS